MSFRPICQCEFCGDWFDIYVPPGERVCDACCEMLEISHDDLREMPLVESGSERHVLGDMEMHDNADRRD